MLEQIPSLLSAVVGDTFSAYSLAAGNVAGVGFSVAAQKLINRRTEAARDILIAELKRGERSLTAPELDEAVAVLLRYWRAAQEGTARLNLRLMAQVISGQAHLGCLYADEFLRQADLLASLRREEIIYLGELIKQWFALEIYQNASEETRIKETNKLLVTQLVPIPFSDREEMEISAAALVRTGFLRGTNLFSGSAVYKPTKALLRLAEITNFEAAISSENP